MKTLIDAKIFWGNQSYSIRNDPLGIMGNILPWYQIKKIELTYNGPSLLPAVFWNCTNSASGEPAPNILITNQIGSNLVVIEFITPISRGIIDIQSIYDSNEIDFEQVNVNFKVLTGDTNNSGTVDTFDLLRIRQNFGQVLSSNDQKLFYDIDGSGVVDMNDYAVAGQNRLKKLP